ncbi:MAG: hypothetical protein L6R39_002891 [Caloplaca ligustica]|nr:MAG: hypothetical protein L6R39_002891 [Caloplaca ligustica]
MNEDKTLLNFPVTCHLKGRPTTAVLQRAMLEMKRRNKSLRRSYFEGDNFAEQKPVEDFGVHLDYQDFSSAEPPRIRQGRNLALKKGRFSEPLWPKLDETDYALVLVFHHIANDHGSSKSFLDQLTSIYDAIWNGKDLLSVPSPKIQYQDFSIWHNAQ